MDSDLEIVNLQREDNEENLYTIIGNNVESSSSEEDDEIPAKGRTTNNATKGKNNDEAESSSVIMRTSGYRVVVKSWPFEVYTRAGVDNDYLDKCTTRKVIQDCDTMEAAIQCARDCWARTMQFDDWSIEYYKNISPPFLISNGTNNQDEYEGLVALIFVEDISSAICARRETQMTNAGVLPFPNMKTAKISKYDIGTAVCKLFLGSFKFFGKVIAYDPKAEYYMIRYEDGDMEEMEETEVDDHVVHVLSPSLWFD